MNPITLTEIRENGPTLIILSIIPFLLFFSGLTLLTYFENINPLVESAETSETLIISIITYSIVGLILYIMVGPYRGEKTAVVGTFIIAVLCVSVMMVATTSIIHLNT